MSMPAIIWIVAGSSTLRPIRREAPPTNDAKAAGAKGSKTQFWAFDHRVMR